MAALETAVVEKRRQVSGDVAVPQWSGRCGAGLVLGVREAVLATERLRVVVLEQKFVAFYASLSGCTSRVKAKLA